MNQKWYLVALIIALTLLGVGQHQISVPNQEIVVQFDDYVSSDEAKTTVTILRKQLINLGAANIIVSENEEGKLKISYFSNLDIARIKYILSKENQLELGIVDSQEENNSNIPIKENQNTYNFEVYEIQKETNSDWDFNGTNVLELHPEGNRFSKPKIYAAINETDFKEKVLKVTFKVNYRIAIAIDNTSQNTPDVRAGPIA